MKPERWQRIDHLFHEALQRAPEDRDAFLDETCVGDETLRMQVASLLSARMKAGSFMESAALEVEARALANDRINSSMLGRVIGHYSINSSIGRGAMGDVYLAQDLQLGRKVALKFLPAPFTLNADRVRRFQQEARAASSLSHPNIITIHEIGQAEGQYFIATEFVAGDTLRQRIRESKEEGGSESNSKETAISLREVLNIGMQIADALAAAHAKGIVHRDIKPENIMLVGDTHLLNRDNFVKLLDFGVAKLAEKTEEAGEDATTRMQVDTREGSIIGTAVYMSPEQARGENVDARTDIWSLGVVLYEMLSARPPFGGETNQDVIASILRDEPPPFPSNIPTGLKQIVAKALQKNRDDRYQRMQDVFLGLKALAKEVESQSQTDTRESNTIVERQHGNLVEGIDHKTRVQPTHRIVAIGVAGLLVSALTIWAYYFFRPQRNPRINSLAVLPFDHADGDRELAPIAEGLTGSLINNLSQLPDLTVKPYVSVSRYKGKDVTPQTVAAELSVQGVMYGRLLKQGDNLTLTLYLTDGITGDQTWGEPYYGKVSNLVSLQNDVARDVSRKLRARLSGDEEQRVTKDATANSQALRLYYGGRSKVFNLTAAEVFDGISLFQQAIEIDPNFALAYVGLSDANATLGIAGEEMPTVFLPRSKEAAQKAIDLNDGLAEAHVALGRAMFWHDWNWRGAENEYQRALEIDPNNGDAHQFYAHLLSNINRHVEALAEIKRARELNKFAPFTDALEGLFLNQAGKPDEALASLSKAAKGAPGFWLPHLFASSAFIDKGMFEEALAEARRAKELNPRQTRSIALEGYILAKLGKHDEARAKLTELLRLTQKQYVPPSHVALLYNGMGERKETLAWLQRGYYERDPKMAFLKVERLWDNLRNDPQFMEIVRSLNFPE